MTSHRRWQIAVAALAYASLLIPLAATAGETLLPPDRSAPPVRVLLILPADGGKLTRQVALLDRALAESRGFLSRARSLDEADVLVEFTGFRQTVDDKGVPLLWWYGQYRLLTTPVRDVRLRKETPSRFSMVLADELPWNMKPVVDLLSRTLARALGREARPQKADSI